MDLLNNTAKDFAMNESFQKWILNPDDVTHQHWETYRQMNPEKHEILQEARALVLKLRTCTGVVHVKELSVLWSRIADSIQEFEQEKLNRKIANAEQILLKLNQK